MRWNRSPARGAHITHACPYFNLVINHHVSTQTPAKSSGYFKKNDFSTSVTSSENFFLRSAVNLWKTLPITTEAIFYQRREMGQRSSYACKLIDGHDRRFVFEITCFTPICAINFFNWAGGIVFFWNFLNWMHNISIILRQNFKLIAAKLTKVREFERPLLQAGAKGCTTFSRFSEAFRNWWAR